MHAPIPPEFEAFARQQVEAGLIASEEDAVAKALRAYLWHVDEVRRLVDPALAEADRGEGMDGGAFMADLIAEADAASRR